MEVSIHIDKIIKFATYKTVFLLQMVELMS